MRTRWDIPRPSLNKIALLYQRSAMLGLFSQVVNLRDRVGNQSLSRSQMSDACTS